MTKISRGRELASLVRLQEDKTDPNIDFVKIKAREHHRDTMLRHGVLLSESVTPVLEERLSDVCHTMGIPRCQVTAFVYNSAEVQADCLIDSHETCVLRFTSGLINLMDEEEFKFISGHELGHFLLGHGACAQNLLEDSAEDYIVRRARELSADRIGFLSNGDLEGSIRAIIKTASGLDKKFLRFDISSFLSQIDMIVNPSKGESKNSTHPSMLIRCRSLLWFSMSIHSISDVVKSNEKKNKRSRCTCG